VVHASVRRVLLDTIDSVLFSTICELAGDVFVAIRVSAFPHLLSDTVDGRRHAHFLRPTAIVREPERFGLYHPGGRNTTREGMLAHGTKETDRTPPSVMDVSLMVERIVHMTEGRVGPKNGFEELEWVCEGECVVIVETIGIEEAMVKMMMVAIEMVMVVMVAIVVVVSAKVSGVTRFWGWPDTMHVVELSILWVHEDLVRVIHLAKLLLCRCLVFGSGTRWQPVWVGLKCPFSVCLANLFWGCILVDFEYLVEIGRH